MQGLYQRAGIGQPGDVRRPARRVVVEVGEQRPYQLQALIDDQRLAIEVLKELSSRRRGVSVPPWPCGNSRRAIGVWPLPRFASRRVLRHLIARCFARAESRKAGLALIFSRDLVKGGIDRLSVHVHAHQPAARRQSFDCHIHKSLSPKMKKPRVIQSLSSAAEHPQQA